MDRLAGPCSWWRTFWTQLVAGSSISEHTEPSTWGVKDGAFRRQVGVGGIRHDVVAKLTDTGPYCVTPAALQGVTAAGVADRTAK